MGPTPVSYELRPGLGFADERALQIDHRAGNGNAERRAVNNNAPAIYRRVLREPHRYQLLCANCNWIKRAENQEY